MKALSRRSGFSLVELLTVIAIIAILAAIIFPVMGMVKERARQNQCISNIKQIGMGIGLFKEDNRRYPLALVPVANDAQSGAALPFDQAKSDAGLMGEYVKGGFSIFRCPSSKETDKNAVVDQPMYPNGKVYTYNAYEGIVSVNGVYEQHYCINWADKENDVSALTSDGNTDKQDYQRQLKFRTPPDDTVVTWCSWHEVRDATGSRGKAIVLFLGGEAVQMDAKRVEERKWRVKQD